MAVIAVIVCPLEASVRTTEAVVVTFSRSLDIGGSRDTAAFDITAVKGHTCQHHFMLVTKIQLKAFWR